MPPDEIRELAKICGSCDLQLASGFVVLCYTLRYVDSGEQGFSHNIDNEYIKGMLAVWGVERLSRIKGQMCYVVRERASDLVRRIEPVFSDEGTTFDIRKWGQEKGL